jgi:hypothetical protein
VREVADLMLIERLFLLQNLRSFTRVSMSTYCARFASIVTVKFAIVPSDTVHPPAIVKNNDHLIFLLRGAILRGRRIGPRS